MGWWLETARTRWARGALLAACFAAALPAAHAQEKEKGDSEIAFKLTPSWYHSSDANDANDLNLRGNLGAHTAWAGYYHDKAGYSQARAGYENRFEAGVARVTLSGQLASGGFAGGSVSAELGGENYAIAGFGRTNLRAYYNLNFDPNDAITLGVGSRAFADTELALFHLWDDRLGTQQQVTHAVVRRKMAGEQRLTVDVSHKSGLTADGNFVSGNALTLTYDYRNWFARLARDQYVNFTNTDQTRFSLGMRF
jgi:hypothetical protein